MAGMFEDHMWMHVVSSIAAGVGGCQPLLKRNSYLGMTLPFEKLREEIMNVQNQISDPIKLL